LASLCLRSGIKVDEIVQALKGANCAACLDRKKAGVKVSNSCGSCIGEALEKYYNELKGITPKTKMSAAASRGGMPTLVVDLAEKLMPCPECKEETLRPDGKCYTCHNCGYSRCD
jgi:NAD(P)H-nitrite reductase large subunit